MENNKRQRSSARKAITTSIKTARTYLDTEADLNKIESKLKDLAALLRSKQNTLEELDIKILDSCEVEEELDREATETNEYQTNIFICLAEIESALAKLRINSNSMYTESRLHYSGSRSSSPTIPRRTHLRRPQLSMEPFDGNPLLYRSFMDSFESSIDSDEGLSNVDKFLYLKGLLKGKALNTIQGLSLTTENYKEAMQLLKSGYGDKKNTNFYFLQPNFTFETGY